MASVKGSTKRKLWGRHATSSSKKSEEKEKVADSEKDKNKNEVYTESVEETDAARRIPSRRRLSSGGMLRKSQQKHTKRPSLFRSFTSDALFSSRRKKKASTGSDVPVKGESCAEDRQDSRERRHSTPTDITQQENDLVWKSEVDQEVQVLADQVNAQQVVKLPVQKANTTTSVKTSGESHDFSSSSVVSGMKCDRDSRDRKAKSLPVNSGVHDLPFVANSAGPVNEKPTEFQQTSHDIFRRHTQYRNPIKRDKQIRRQSLPVFLNTSALRKEFENELKSQENFPKDDKFDRGTIITGKVDTNSKSMLREDKKSPRTTVLKGLKSSLLELFLEQKEVDEVHFNEQREGINQEKIHLHQNCGTQCRRFSLPSRLEDFYCGDEKKGNSSLNDNLFSGTINNCQDLKSDLGNVSQNTTDITQQDFKSKENRRVRSKSLPRAFMNFFSNIESGYRQKEPLPANSGSPRRTKSLPKLTKLNDFNMEGDYGTKCGYTSAENSLNIERSTQEVDGDTLEQFTQLGRFSATRSNSPPFDIDKSINTSTTLTSDLDDEIQEITKCVESVIRGFYKHKEQSGQASVSHLNEELRQVKTCDCTNSLPLNTNSEVSTASDIGNLEDGKQIGLTTTEKDLEIYSDIIIPPGQMGRNICHENVDNIVHTETERSPNTTSQEGCVSLDQTSNYICNFDCATTVNDSAPVEFSESGDKSEKLLLSDDMTAEMEQEIHTEVDEQRTEESPETRPAEATQFTAFELSKSKQGEAIIEDASTFDILEERKAVLEKGSPDFDPINDFSVQDQLSIENNKMKRMEDIFSSEKNESKNLTSERHDGTNKLLCVTENLVSEQKSAAPREIDEKSLEEFPHFDEDEITSERAEVEKRAKQKSNYVENPRDILHDVIQSVLEELFCQVEILNKTDAVRDNSSSVPVDKSLIENSSSEHGLETTIHKKDDAQRELSTNAAKFQDDIFEKAPSSDTITNSDIISDHIESSPPDTDIAMIIPKQKEELQEKTSDSEIKESEEKVRSENDLLLSLENDKELHSESVNCVKDTESEEFENEVEEILEKVDCCSDVIDGETSENSAKISPPLSEDNFTNFDVNIRADNHIIESDKGQENDSICPFENGETGQMSSQTQEPKHDVEDSLTVAEREKESREGDAPKQDHAILSGNLVNITDESHKSVITESAAGSEVERSEKQQDFQLPGELKTANTENSADQLQDSADTERSDLHLNEKQNCEGDNDVCETERSQEVPAPVVSLNPEAMKLDKEEDILTVKNDSSSLEKPTETSQEKLNESAASVETIQLPEIILPCEKIETLPEAPSPNFENKKEDILTTEQENKEQLGEHAEMIEKSKLSDNLQEEPNGRKSLKLKLKENNSEVVDNCDHGSPIDKLTQELDAFAGPPFNRPRVYTLPLTHRMEKIVEAPCEKSPDTENKEFPSVFSKGLPSHMLQLKRTGSLCRDVTKKRTEKTRRSLSAPSTMLHQKSGKHDLYPVQEEPEATELSFEDRMELFDKLLSSSLETILEPDYTRSKSPLHRAIAKQRFDCVEFLIECGVDINANDESGWPPLHVAVTSGCFDCAVLLVEAGADLGGYTDSVMQEYKRLRRQVYCRTF